MCETSSKAVDDLITYVFLNINVITCNVLLYIIL